MYKSRIKQWNLGKNVKQSELLNIMESDEYKNSSQDSNTLVVDGRVLDAKRLERSIQRQHKAGSTSYHGT